MLKWLQVGKVVEIGLALKEGSWVKQLEYNP
jgi:hypothetical protein